MCIGCIVSALTRTFEWKMALLSRITAVLYSTPSSLFDHGRRVYSVFPFFFPLENSLSFEMFPSHGLANFLFTPFDGVRSFEGLVRWFENWKPLEGFFVIRVRSILHREYFWRDSGKFEKFKWIKWRSYLFSFFFGKESRGEVSFHEYLIEIRDLERKRKRRNKVEWNGKVITCFL